MKLPVELDKIWRGNPPAAPSLIMATYLQGLRDAAEKCVTMASVRVNEAKWAMNHCADVLRREADALEREHGNG